MTCQIRLKEEGKSYPRTCSKCGISKRCAEGRDTESRAERIKELEAASETYTHYGIVTRDYYYEHDSNYKTYYDSLQVYEEYDVFSARITELTLSGAQFTAYKLHPAQIDTTVKIKF